jgi:hypothetical protein
MHSTYAERRNTPEYQDPRSESSKEEERAEGKGQKKGSAEEALTLKRGGPPRLVLQLRALLLSYAQPPAQGRSWAQGLGAAQRGGRVN